MTDSEKFSIALAAALQALGTVTSSKVDLTPKGDVGLHFGNEPSGQTGLAIHEGTENILRIYAQDVIAANFSGGAISSTYNTWGDVLIADDDIYEIGPNGDFPIDRSGFLHISAPGISTTYGGIHYRIAAGSYGEADLAYGVNVEVKSSGSIPLLSECTDGKLTVVVCRPADKLYIVNRRGVDAKFTGTHFGHGGGLNK